MCYTAIYSPKHDQWTGVLHIYEHSIGILRPNFCNTEKGHSNKKVVEHGEFSVEIYPAMSDNFMFLIKSNHSKGVIAVDPVDHKLVSFMLAGSGYYLDSILWNGIEYHNS